MKLIFSKPAFSFPLALSALPAAAYAADQANPASVGSLFQVLFGLVAVLGLMAGAAWLLKRFGAVKTGAASTIKVVGGVSVGNRERVLVLEVADQWIVVGVAPGQVNALASMPRREGAPATEAVPNTPNFAAWLKKTIDKRNGN